LAPIFTARTPRKPARRPRSKASGLDEQATRLQSPGNGGNGVGGGSHHPEHRVVDRVVVKPSRELADRSAGLETLESRTNGISSAEIGQMSRREDPPVSMPADAVQYLAVGGFRVFRHALSDTKTTIFSCQKKSDFERYQPSDARGRPIHIWPDFSGNGNANATGYADVSVQRAAVLRVRAGAARSGPLSSRCNDQLVCRCAYCAMPRIKPRPCALDNSTSTATRGEFDAVMTLKAWRFRAPCNHRLPGWFEW